MGMIKTKITAWVKYDYTSPEKIEVEFAAKDKIMSDWELIQKAKENDSFNLLVIVKYFASSEEARDWAKGNLTPDKIRALVYPAKAKTTMMRDDEAIQYILDNQLQGDYPAHSKRLVTKAVEQELIDESATREEVIKAMSKIASQENAEKIKEAKAFLNKKQTTSVNIHRTEKDRILSGYTHEAIAKDRNVEQDTKLIDKLVRQYHNAIECMYFNSCKDIVYVLLPDKVMNVYATQLYETVAKMLNCDFIHDENGVGDNYGRFTNNGMIVDPDFYHKLVNSGAIRVFIMPVIV